MKRKNLKKLCLPFLLLMQVLMLTLLSGCQLAVEDADEASGDRLVGVFVTTEYLDLFDMEGYIDDNLRVTGGEILVEGDTSEYYGRVYAQKTAIDEHRVEYEFPELDGFGYYALIEYGDTPLDNLHYCYSDEGISDPKNHYKSTDEGEGLEMDGTVYFPADGSNAVFYFNPVYQTSDGNVYVTSGQGFSTDSMVEGQNYSQTMEETTTITMDGETLSWSTAVTTSIEGIHLPEKYILLSMDDESHVLRSQEYAPGNLPAEMSIPADTAYLVLETYKTNEEGEPIVERGIINRGDDSFFTFCLNGMGVCVKEYTYLTWN